MFQYRIMRKPQEKPSDLLWPAVAAGTVIWVSVIGWHYWWRGVLLTSLALAAFMLGCAIAFVFTSYGEETNSIGKIKDWLVGGVTVLTIAELRSIKPLLLIFAASDSAADYGLVVSTAVVYVILGFFFMFLERELILNIMLARGRAARGRIEGTAQAGKLALDLIASIPPALLAGNDDIDDAIKHGKSAQAIKQSLQSADTQKFLDQCEADLHDGLSLDWDVVSKVAYIHYFRTYFSTKEDAPDDLRLALAWIRRALVICPQHVDFTCKMAAIYAAQQDWAQTVLILEGVRRGSDCPMYVDQWLGYYLLYLRGREDEAMRCSEAYLNHFPASNEARRNLASAHAQKACNAAQSNDGVLDIHSHDYREALKHAALALKDNEPYRKTMQTTWIAQDGSFSCFGKDHGYRKLVGLEGHNAKHPKEADQEEPEPATPSRRTPAKFQPL